MRLRRARRRHLCSIEPMLVRYDELPERDLRLATELARIHAAAFAGEERSWSGPEILALLNEQGVELRLAHHESPDSTGRLVPVGFALCRVAADEAELLTLAVEPECRRSGIGAALLSDCETGAGKAGATRLFLEVGAGNHAARRLYERAGYREAGRRKGYYERPDGSRDDALIMEKAL